MARLKSRFSAFDKLSLDDLLKAKRDEYVFRLRDGDRTKNLFSVFNQFLIDHKLLKDPHGDNRTLYSLRHMYATMRLVEDGIPVHQLAKQMGTSIQMIDKYYSHLQPMMIAEKLAGKRPEKKPVKRKKPL